MGYYIGIEESNWVVPAENLGAAYEAMCELNKHDDLKRGGSYGPNGKEEVWFAWMPANYPEVYETAKEILEALGFECSVDDEGNLHINYYHSKSGNEDIFLEAIAPHSRNGSSMVWRGEEGERWRYEVINGALYEQDAIEAWGRARPSSPAATAREMNARFATA